MRVGAEQHGIFAKAYSGTTGVLLAFDVAEELRRGLLGFAVEREIRSGRRAGERAWLQGILDFAGSMKAPGRLIDTNLAPVQKFRWSDYAVYPSTAYAYTVYAVHAAGPVPVTAEDRRLRLTQGPMLEVFTQGFDGSTAAIFNRAVASSQAFSRRFPEIDKEIETARRAASLETFSLPARALDWLSRGLVERIEAFLAQALDDSWSVDLAIYEYELPRLHASIVAAAKRGAKVRVVYHARTSDPAAAENEHMLAHPPIPGAMLYPRATSKIMHDKFVVLSRIVGQGARAPYCVLAGSTNWTENGCYRQANVVQTTSDPELVVDYARMFETLVETHEDVKATRRWITANNTIPAVPEKFAGFSPRTGGGDLEAIVRMVAAARRDVFFLTAFDLRREILEALKGSPNDRILRLGLQNKRSSITGLHRDRTADFSAAVLLPGGIEGWLKETMAGQRGSIRIHTKAIVVDATSDEPLVLSGSHNLSASASSGNDENFMVIRGDTELADVYLCEMMRMYDHYRFRFAAKERQKPGVPLDPPMLAGDDSWTEAYFSTGSMKELDRLCFAGRPVA